MALTPCYYRRMTARQELCLSLALLWSREASVIKADKEPIMFISFGPKKGLKCAEFEVSNHGVYFAGHGATTVAPRAIHDLMGLAANSNLEKKADSKIL